MSNTDTMRGQLLQFIIEELLDGEQIESNENLLADGVVDSLGMMRLVAFVQEKVGTSIPPQDLTLENFRTVDAISSYLENEFLSNERP